MKIETLSFAKAKIHSLWISLEQSRIYRHEAPGFAGFF
jgi:hypothetical protein